MGETNERKRPNGDKPNELSGNGQREKLQAPGQLDFEKARKGLEKIVRENHEWLKEMASR